VAADPDPPDDADRDIAPAGNPAPRPGPADPAVVGPSQARPDVVPFSRWLSPLVRLMRSKAVRFGFLAIVLALLGVALTDQAGTLWDQVSRLSVPVVLLAFLLCLCGLFGSLMVWREILADLGSRLSIPEAARIMFIGQLGKYVPGSIWPVLAQSELGADCGIPRSRSAVSVLVSYAVMSTSGIVVAIVTLPFATAASIAQYFWILFLLPVAAVLLSPPVLNRLLRLVLRVSRQPVMDQNVSYRGLARTMLWALFGWSANGLMVYVLMRQLAGHPQGLLLVSVGAYSLSWSVGFLAVFAPAGAGVREAVMVAILSTRTTIHTAPLTVALLCRALSVVADAVVGAAAAALVGRRRLRRLRAERSLTRP
jgi:glycosyltransferase 2 family protein